MSSDAMAIERKLGSIQNLPTLPLALRQMQKVMKDPRSSMGQIAMVVAKDPAMASRAIRLVNSAFYGMRERVTSINHAIVILGLNTLNGIMIGISVIKLFKNSPIIGFSPEKFWEHCFGTALLAKSLAEIEENSDPDQLFITGLLHDMGRLLLEQFLHEEFSKSLLLARQGKKPLLECEKEILHFDHAGAGAWLGRKWGLPEVIIASMGYHHRKQDLPDDLQGFSEQTRIVSAANRLCNYAAIGSSGETPYCSSALCPVENVPEQKIKEIVDKARSEVRLTIEEWNKAL